MKIVLLPGLDGTGILFEPFLKRINDRYVTEVIQLPDDPDYVSMAISISEKLRDDELIILAESYSGPLAFKLAKDINLKISHIFFFASFLSQPSQISRFSKLIPLSFIQAGAFPRSVIGKVLFGKYNSQYLLNLFYKALKAVDISVLRARLSQISTLEAPASIIKIPCTYVRGLSDNLISPKVLDTFRACCEDLSIKEIQGTHFLLQTNPDDCWELVNEKIAL